MNLRMTVKKYGKLSMSCVVKRRVPLNPHSLLIMQRSQTVGQGLGLGKVAGPQGVDQGRVPDVCRMLQCLTPLCHWAVRGYSDCFPKHFIISSPINPAEPGTRQYSVSWCELISYPHCDWQRTEVPVNPAMRREGSCPLNYFARIGPFQSPKPL